MSLKGSFKYIPEQWWADHSIMTIIVIWYIYYDEDRMFKKLLSVINVINKDVKPHEMLSIFL